MFGYLRPMQGELKVRELERFKACYCGLCHALGKKYGFAARFVLSYELVFLSMLLWGEDETPQIKRRRCIASPCLRKRYCTSTIALDSCAGYNVILFWWKLRDTIADEPYVKSIPHRFLSLVMSGAYKRAARELPAFDEKVREELRGLDEFESTKESSLDASADKFARILSATVPNSMPEEKRRPLLEILYHIGRWIYIIDACDDYCDDVKSGGFNPVAAEFPPETENLPGEAAAWLRTTLTHSNNLIGAAFELLPENAWTQTVGNVIYNGMPEVCERICDGTWKQWKKGIN